MPPDAAPGSGEQGAHQFHATHWSVVLAAGDSRAPGSAQALERLCRAYWFPIYAFVRRQGVDAHEAQDLTQAFFTRLLDKKALGQVDPAKGKFRSFLLASLTNFLNNERDKAKRLKRGGDAEFVYLDARPAEERYLAEPSHSDSPERVFERRWATAVLEQVAARLQEELTAQGQAKRFEILKGFLMGDSDKVSYERAAAELGLSVSAVTSSIYRLRLRFRELFRAEIASTVGSASEIDEEIRHLLAALSS